VKNYAEHVAGELASGSAALESFLGYKIE